MLMNEDVRYGHEGPKKWSEGECFFGWAKLRSEGVRFDIKSNIPNNSIDDDKYQ